MSLERSTIQFSGTVALRYKAGHREILLNTQTTHPTSRENGYRSKGTFHVLPDPRPPFPSLLPMFLGRSLQGYISLLNESSDSAARSFDSPSSLQMSSHPNNSNNSPPRPSPAHPFNVPRTSTTVEKKSNHTCQTCSKAFTTLGHFARHIRVHTGDRNHKCPFPGCETLCSRQDNLQQQYVFFSLPSLKD
jgi:uncharacterized Zn-finger protein